MGVDAHHNAFTTLTANLTGFDLQTAKEIIASANSPDALHVFKKHGHTKVAVPSFTSTAISFSTALQWTQTHDGVVAGMVAC